MPLALPRSPLGTSFKRWSLYSLNRRVSSAYAALRVVNSAVHTTSYSCGKSRCRSSTACLVTPNFQTLSYGMYSKYKVPLISVLLALPPQELLS